MQLSTRHLLGIKNLTKEDISLILSTAEQFKEVLQRPVKKVPSLRDVTIVNLFYENSILYKEIILFSPLYISFIIVIWPLSTYEDSIKN